MGSDTLLNGLLDELEALLVVLNVRSESTFVTNVDGILAVLGSNDGLEVVVDFDADAHGLREARGANGEDHELLHGKLVASVGAAVDHVKRGDGEDELVGALAGELGNVPANLKLINSLLGS